jgi:glycosyltransferase involved in cell wall biosynthesis
VLTMTAIICTAGERRSLQGALQSLVAQRSSPDLELEIVVVDNSQDASGFVKRVTEAAGECSPVPVRCVREPRAGIAFARNTGIEAATGEVVAFLDDDAVADSAWASELAKAYRETDAVVVGGRINLIWEVTRPAWLGDDLSPFLGLLDHGPDRMRCRYPRYPFGGNISFRRAVVRGEAGFATDLGSGGAATFLMDEMELCRRIENRGGPIIYAPEAKVGHIVSASRATRGFFLRRAAMRGRAIARVEWGSDRARITPARYGSGEFEAAIRAIRHGVKTLVYLATGQYRKSLSESRHLVSNLTWMYETGVIALTRS